MRRLGAVATDDASEAEALSYLRRSRRFTTRGRLWPNDLIG